MTPQEFVYWIKGYLAAQTYDSQLKVDIENALRQVNEHANPNIKYGNSNITSLSNHPNITSTYNTKQQLND
jgi:muconolactone delta-isomerase